MSNTGMSNTAPMSTGSMGMGGGMTVPMAQSWTAAYATLMFLMWAVMMAAMMPPRCCSPPAFTGITRNVPLRADQMISNQTS